MRYLAFTGIATNICVESTIRDALYRGYFPILIKDCAAAAGPEYMQDAVIHNLTICFGWITTSEDIIKAIKEYK
jgi:ureidoacrylate peracid hydrolase